MIINFGSINIDHVYWVGHMPQPGETRAVSSYQRFLGGKGANQSIAIAKSGGDVRHVGAVGADGKWAIDQLRDLGVDPSHVIEAAEPTGHAIVMVDDTGENQILICSAANRCLTAAQIERELQSKQGEGNWVLVQNETNLVGDIVRQSKARGFKVCYSAAPFVAEDTLPLLGDVDLLVVNQVEVEALAEAAGSAVADLACRATLITKGAAGAEFQSNGTITDHAAFHVTAVDTTGAGDTFLGAFLAHFSSSSDVQHALLYASAASAIQVTRPGAGSAIPDHREVAQFLKERTL